jgi:hypothetical protein
MTGLPKRNNLLDALSLEAPLGHGEVAEHVFHEQPVWNCPRFKKLNKESCESVCYGGVHGSLLCRD